MASEELKGKKVLISAGGTREYMDAVRFISNASSGKMGYALAEEAVFRGAGCQSHTDALTGCMMNYRELQRLFKEGLYSLL